jgi:hypothetical protein
MQQCYRLKWLSYHNVVSKDDAGYKIFGKTRKILFHNTLHAFAEEFDIEVNKQIKGRIPKKSDIIFLKRG